MTLMNKASKRAATLPVVGPLFKIKPKIAVVHMSGIIADSSVKRAGISYARYEKLLEQAFDLYKLQGVALVINSPGGSPAQSALIGQQIRKLAHKHEVPVYAFVEDVAASGGYWLACAADKIYALDVSIVGSIGVISASFGFDELIERYGVKRRLYTAGKEKAMLDPFLPEKQADVAKLKKIQKSLHGSFIDWVKERRGEMLSGKDSEYFEGQIWVGKDAVENGIIDGIGSVKDVSREAFGEDVKFVDFYPEKRLINALLGTDAETRSLRDVNIPRDLAGVLEEKALWGRFGL